MTDSCVTNTVNKNCQKIKVLNKRLNNIMNNVSNDSIFEVASNSAAVVRYNTANPELTGNENFLVADTSLNGPGSKLFFDTEKSAVRAGKVTGTQWDDASRGNFSVAFGEDNTASRDNSSVAGGKGNSVGGPLSFIGSGDNNSISVNTSVIGGGVGNSIPAVQGNTTSFIGGGDNNNCSGARSFIGGGSSNSVGVNTPNSVIAGGKDNMCGVLNGLATISGGENNTVQGEGSTIPGGKNNTCTGDGSFCGGISANDGGSNNTFVWADVDGLTPKTTDNSFWVAAQGGSTFYSNKDRDRGVELPNGASSWMMVSDRNLKENIVELDHVNTLEKLDKLPIYNYNFKDVDKEIINWGPVAQEWNQLFETKKNKLKIDTLDLDGVSLSAIKGLYQLVKSQQKEIDELKEKINKLENN
jgi:hypothetical protein